MVQYAFSAQLRTVDDAGENGGAPLAVTTATVLVAIRCAPWGSAPGPSELRLEHLLAPDAAGLDALLGLLELLASDAVVRRFPPLAAHALAGADLF